MPDCSVVLSALANVSSRDSGEIQKTFLAGAPHLRVKPDGPSSCRVKNPGWNN